jgi:CubicO group peptidase (beta-lactamase class C family)
MAFGRTSLAFGTPSRAETLFEIGSITKTFTGIALAREIEQGTVQLDQPVQELLPPDITLPEAARSVTLRHLTTHTSGFPRLPANMSPIGGIKMLMFGSNPYAGYGEADFAEALRIVKLDSTPGAKSSYSNFGGGLLGWLLARKAGTNYEAFVKREVCEPLGMHDTTVTLEAKQAARFAQGYRALRRAGPVLLGLRASPWLLPNHLAGAGALRSTGGGMLRYLEANMRPTGRPLEKALSESHRELFREDEQTAIGMNWIRSRNNDLKQVVIWHNGGTGGFFSFIGFTEDGRAGVAILSNTAESVDLLGIVLLQDVAKQH